MTKDDLTKLHEEISQNLEEGFSELAKVMAEAIMGQEPSHGKMVPKQAQTAKFAHELQHELITFKRRLENGGKWLGQSLEQISKTHTEINMLHVNEDLAKIAEFMATLPEHAERLAEGIAQDLTFQETAGMRNSSLEALYKATKYLYEHQQYQEAADCFGILTFLNPKHFVFWLGFGNAEYFCHRYEPALIAYALAVQIDPDNPYPHLYSAKCYEELHQLDNAINALDIALFVINGEKTYDSIRGLIRDEKVRLQHKLNK